MALRLAPNGHDWKVSTGGTRDYIITDIIQMEVLFLGILTSYDNIFGLIVQHQSLDAEIFHPYVSEKAL